MLQQQVKQPDQNKEDPAVTVNSLQAADVFLSGALGKRSCHASRTVQIRSCCAASSLARAGVFCCCLPPPPLPLGAAGGMLPPYPTSTAAFSSGITSCICSRFASATCNPGGIKQLLIRIYIPARPEDFLCTQSLWFPFSFSFPPSLFFFLAS